MLIKAFCDATGLPRDTVRFYVKHGLLTPDVGSRPGNRYQVFDDAQVERARLIKIAQALGFSLKEIAGLAKAYAAAAIGPEEKVALLRSRLSALDEQERLVGVMRAYLAAKIRWIEDGERGPPPSVEEALQARARPAPKRAGSRASPKRDRGQASGIPQGLARGAS